MEKPTVIKIEPVEEWTLKALKFVCKNHKVKGYTKMSREELVVAVRDVITKISNRGDDNRK